MSRQTGGASGGFQIPPELADSVGAGGFRGDSRILFELGLRPDVPGRRTTGEGPRVDRKGLPFGRAGDGVRGREGRRRCPRRWPVRRNWVARGGIDVGASTAAHRRQSVDVGASTSGHRCRRVTDDARALRWPGGAGSTANHTVRDRRRWHPWSAVMPGCDSSAGRARGRGASVAWHGGRSAGMPRTTPRGSRPGHRSLAMKVRGWRSIRMTTARPARGHCRRSDRIRRRETTPHQNRHPRRGHRYARDHPGPGRRRWACRRDRRPTSDRALGVRGTGTGFGPTARSSPAIAAVDGLADMAPAGPRRRPSRGVRVRYAGRAPTSPTVTVAVTACCRRHSRPRLSRCIASGAGR